MYQEEQHKQMKKKGIMQILVNRSAGTNLLLSCVLFRVAWLHGSSSTLKTSYFHDSEEVKKSKLEVRKNKNREKEIVLSNEWLDEFITSLR